MSPSQKKNDYTLLNHQEWIKNHPNKGEQKIVEKTRNQVFATLQLNYVPVSPGTVAFQLYESRKNNNGLPSTIQVDGKDISIDQNKYQDIFNNYKHFSNENNEEGIKGTDWALANRIILDNGHMIDFADDENSAKNTYNDLNKDATYAGKIDLLGKKQANMMHFIIKWKEEELQKINDTIQQALDNFKIKKEENNQKRKMKKENENKNINEKEEIKKENIKKDNENNKIKGLKTTEKTETKEILEDNLFVNRDNVAQDIRKLRGSDNNNIPSGELPIKPGNRIKLEDQKDYQYYCNEYAKNKGDDKRCKQLDTEFAERIILDNPKEEPLKNKYQIQINNEGTTNEKSEEELTTEATTCRDSLIKLGYPVEYVKIIIKSQENLSKKKELEGLLQEIKYVQKKYDELFSELNSDRLHYNELDRRPKEEELKRLQKKLDGLHENQKQLEKEIDSSNSKIYHIVRLVETKPVLPEPEPILPEPVIPNPEISGEAEVTATLSDTMAIRRSIAEREASEELQKRYKKTGIRNIPDKINLFLRRRFIKDRMVQDKINYTSWNNTGRLSRDNDTTSAADRHEMEQQSGFNKKITRILETIENDFPNTQLELQQLIAGYTGDASTGRTSTMTDTTFQVEFDRILAMSGSLDSTRPATATLNPRRPLTELIKQEDIQQMSTNILEKTKVFKDHQTLTNNISTWIINESTTKYVDRKTNPKTYSDFSDALDKYARPQIANYIKNFKTLPSFLKTLKLNLDNPNTMRDLISFQCNHQALSAISQQTMKLKLQILTKGDEAYNVEEKLNWWAKTGRWIDNPWHNSKYMKEHPGVREFTSYLRGGVKLGTMVGAGIGSAALLGAGTLAAAGITGGVAFTKTLFAKYSHYNKEHRQYLRQQATNLQDKRDERSRIASAVAGMSRWEGRFWGPKHKDRRMMKYYIETSHDQLSFTNELNSRIQDLLQQENLSPAQQNTLIGLTSQGIARLDFHNYTGQNFLGSNQPTIAEKEYQELQRLILTSTLRMGTDMNTLRTDSSFYTKRKISNSYANTISLLNNGTLSGDKHNTQGYRKARERFQSREWQQALIGASKAGAIAFGISYGIGALTAKEATSTTHTTGVDDMRAEYALGKYQDTNYASGNIEKQLTEFLNNTNNVQSGGTLDLTLSGSTDATKVISGNFTDAQLNTWKEAIKQHIDGLTGTGQGHLNLDYANQLKTWIDGNNFPTYPVGHENVNLANMRLLNNIKETAEALANSTNPAVSSGGLHLNISAIATEAPKETLYQASRFSNLAINASQTTTTASSAGYPIGTAWDNTFMPTSENDRPPQQGKNDPTPPAQDKNNKKSD